MSQKQIKKNRASELENQGMMNETENSVSIKEKLFLQTSIYLKDNQSINPTIYYLFQIIEGLSLLWFALHPSLQIYHKDSFLLQQLQLILKTINFYEYLSNNPNSYSIMIGLVVGYLSIQSSIWLWVKKQRNEENYEENESKVKYLRNILKWMFICLAKCLTGPLIGLSINVLSCNSHNPYSQDLQCFSIQHIIFSLFAGVILLSVIFQTLYYSLIYIIKNPFSRSYFACPNRYSCLVKSFFKVIFIMYFTFKFVLQADFLYIILTPVLWLAYIIFFRLFSTHNYNHSIFYVQFFIEGFLFGMSFCALLSYNFEKESDGNYYSFAYSVLISLGIGLLLVNLDKKHFSSFLEVCLEGQIKKQNVQKYFLALINNLIYEEKSSAKNGNFSFYSSAWRKKYNPNRIKQYQSKKLKKGDEQMNQIYQFLLEVVLKHLQEHNHFLLKYMKCELLKMLGYQYYSLHQGLELKEEKLIFTNEFAIFNFLQGFKPIITPKKKRVGLIKMYHYQQQTNYLFELTERCAENNRDYWEELGEAEVSLHKVRNLATNYIELNEQIKKTYKQLISIYPKSTTPTLHYLHYLLQVGVNIKETIKINQQFKNSINVEEEDSLASSVLPTTDNQFESGDQICMVVADTVSSNLGCIVNCNSQTKNLLGFSKKSLIGKNLTKLMPHVYTQLHNSFIIKFLKAEKESQQVRNHDDTEKGKILKSEKNVVALNSDNFLVEVGLSLQVIASCDSLQIVGFLRKKENSGSGLLMVEMNTGEILGIDQKFQTLLKKGLTGKQVIQEQPKLSILFPGFNSKTIQQNEYQELQLQLGHLHSTSKHEDCIINARVKLKQIRPYNENKLGFITVTEKRRDRQRERVYLGRKKYSNRNSNIKYKAIQTEHMVQVRSEMKQEEAVTHHLVSQLGQNQQNGEHVTQLVSLARRINQFVEKKEKIDYKCYLAVFYSVSVVLVTSFFLCILYFQSKYLTNSLLLYKQIDQLGQISNAQAQINFYTNRIWCSVHHQIISQQNEDQFYLSLKSVTQQLAVNYAKFKTAYSKDIFPSIASAKEYSFSLPLIINGSYVYSQLKVNHEQGLSNYIIAAKSMYDRQLINNLTPQAQIHLQLSANYIKKNGDTMLPNILTSLISQFAEYSINEINGSFFTVFVMKLAVMVVGIVFEMTICLVNHIGKRVEYETADIYDSIRLWDIHEMVMKTHHFLNRNKAMSENKSRASLLEIFPNKTFVDIVDQAEDESVQRKSQKKLNQIRKRIRESVEVERELNEETTLIQQKDPHIVIPRNYEDKNKQGLFALFIISSLILAGLIAFSTYFQFRTKQQFKDQIALLKNVGEVRKNLAFLNLFAYHMAKEHNEPTYFELIDLTAAKFYEFSSLTYNQLGNSIFKTIYGDVQTLKSYFGTNLILDQDFRWSIYQRIEISLSSANDKIKAMIHEQFEPKFQVLVIESKSRQLIVILVMWVIGVTTAVLLYWIYLIPLMIHRSQNINMLKMLPAWLIKRNKDVYQYIK